MPLSTPVPRQMLHRRVVQCTGYRREDGLWDIEGHMVDTKTYSFPNEDRGGIIQAGQPLHEMWIRLTVDDHFQIHDVEACTDAAPFKPQPRGPRPPSRNRRPHGKPRTTEAHAHAHTGQKPAQRDGQRNGRPGGERRGTRG